MRWHILSIGKPKLAFAAVGIAEYAARIQPFAALKLDILKASTREVESALLLERSAGMFRIVLDERGDHIASRAFAAKIDSWEQRSVKNVALIIGGADGHTEELRSSADWLWSLSKLTFQHELALLVMLEQLYRAYTIKAGLPYHRD
ncbi:MAG: 23S rRNA (pseudouridine(1915)-N(3))-methyltransferase RlmH [Verrucomicrobiota bacterium]